MSPCVFLGRPRGMHASVANVSVMSPVATTAIDGTAIIVLTWLAA
jgi:hypothetical protein